MMDDKAIAGLASRIKKAGARKVLLQVPEGLKPSALEMARKIERSLGRGAEVMISCEPCYGACDIRDFEARALGCKLLVHVGHTELKLPRKTLVPVIYEEYRLHFDPVPLLAQALHMLKPCKSICLVTTAQYVSSLEPAKKFLEANGKKIHIGQPIKAGYPGQVLGCDYSAAEPFDRLVDCFLYLGTGRFHPIGLATRVSKPVLVLDYELDTLENMHHERDMLLRIGMMQVEKAKEAKNFGVLVSAKPGQENLGTAEKAKKRLEAKGKNAFILVMDGIAPEKLMGMKLEALVNCTCPRLSEDFRQYKMPILNPEDVDKM